MKVLVIIVTYNAVNWIDKCLTSLRQSNLPVEVLIVDNGSKDGTIEYIQNNFNDIHLFLQKQNLGFGKGNNVGMKYALEENFNYVYLLNQDAWILPDTIQRLIYLQVRNPEYGVLSPMQINGSMDSLDMNFANACSNSNCPDFISDIVFKRSKDIYEIEFVMAAHWLISIDCLKKVGGFAPIFTHCGEDDNYLHRVKYHNLKIGICPSAFGIHDREGRVIDSNRAVSSLKPLFLSIICNINYGFFYAFIRANNTLIKTIFYILFKYRKISPLFFPLQTILWMPEIFSTRRETKKQGTYIVNK